LVVVVLEVPLVLLMVVAVVLVVPLVSVPVVIVVDIVSVDMVLVVPVIAVSVDIVEPVSVVMLLSVTLLVEDSCLQAVPKMASATIVRRTRNVFFISFPLMLLCFDCGDFPGLSII
jgi:hypothetical protein